jgi:hypothetical protein
MQPNKDGNIQNIPLHRAIIGEPVQAVWHKWVTVAGEQVVELVLEVPHAWLYSIIPWDCNSNFCVVIRPLTHMRREISRKATLTMETQYVYQEKIADFRRVDENISRLLQNKMLKLKLMKKAWLHAAAAHKSLST